MKESLEEKVAALTKKAKEEGKKIKSRKLPKSSLEQFVKTQAQADLLMKWLKEA
jgi:hypothetical protein